MSYYHSLGYVPVDKTAEAASRTIEFSFDDYCVAQMAKALGKTEDYNRLIGWSKNYVNVFNKETGFFAPRKFDGTFIIRSEKKMKDLQREINGLTLLVRCMMRRA